MDPYKDLKCKGKMISIWFHFTHTSVRVHLVTNAPGDHWCGDHWLNLKSTGLFKEEYRPRVTVQYSAEERVHSGASQGGESGTELLGPKVNGP